MAKEEGFVIDKAAPEQMKAMKAVAKERYLAVAFILSADQSRYGQYIEDLENSFLQGQVKYHKTLTAAYNSIIKWKQDPRNMMQAIGPINGGVSFTNFTSKDEAMALATQGKRVAKDKAHVTCFKCKGTGHYTNECTSEEATGESMLMTVIAKWRIQSRQLWISILTARTL
jgi:Zinc knuckle